MYLARIEYWTKDFFPFGWSGTISGASTLIFSYVGYEVVGSATEESSNPKRFVISQYCVIYRILRRHTATWHEYRMYDCQMSVGVGPHHS